MKATVMMPLCLGMALLTATAQAAPSIYPCDTARFLGTSKFDFKVEFDRELSQSDIDVRINGKSVADVFGAKPEFIKNEEGKALPSFFATFLWLPASMPFPRRTARKKRAPGGTCTARRKRPRPRTSFFSLRTASAWGIAPALVCFQGRDQRHVQRLSFHGHAALHRHARHLQR